jgi:hypothetical protein
LAEFIGKVVAVQLAQPIDLLLVTLAALLGHRLEGGARDGVTSLLAQGPDVIGR